MHCVREIERKGVWEDEMPPIHSFSGSSMEFFVFFQRSKLSVTISGLGMFYFLWSEMKSTWIIKGVAVFLMAEIDTSKLVVFE